MENDYKLVDFDKYCKTCIHIMKDESQEPCNSCLEEPVNLNSHKPVSYKENKRLKGNVE